MRHLESITGVFLGFILLLLMSEGCSPTKTLETSKNTVIKYRDTIVRIVDTVHVKLPADTVRIFDTIQASTIDKKTGERKDTSIVFSMPKIIKSFGIITTEAEVDNSIMIIESYLNDSTLKTRIDTVFIIKDAIKDKTKTEKEKVTVYKCHNKFHDFCVVFFFACVLGAVAYVIIKGKINLKI